MTTYYIDDGGSNTSPFDTWAKAAPDLPTLDAAVTFAAGDIVYVGHDSVDAYSYSGTTNIIGPTSGAPVRIISATQGSSPAAYQKATADQINTGHTYSIQFDGSFVLVGIQASVASLNMIGDSNEENGLYDCQINIGDNDTFTAGTSSGRVDIVDCTFDFSDDGASRSTNVFTASAVNRQGNVIGCTFASIGNRTGGIVDMVTTGGIEISGADFSSLAAGEELAEVGDGVLYMNNCITPSSFTWITGTWETGGRVTAVNVGPANDPTALFAADYYGTVLSSSTIYRTGGAEAEGTNVSWLVTTESTCHELGTFRTPWIYGAIASTGSKTFDLFVVNDTADFDDDEVWVEIEFLGTATEAVFSRADDHRASITATPATQTDDTSSTWNGTGPSFTYKQKLSVTATVNVAGLYRARVHVGVASIASSRNFYIDPAVTVT